MTSSKIEEIFNLAEKKQYLGDYEGALETFSKLIEINPEFSEAFAQRGYLYLYYIFDFEKAKDDLERALELDPKNYVACNSLANLLEKLEKFEEAILFYKRAIEISNQGHDYTSLAKCYNWLKEYENAISNCDLAIKTKLSEEYIDFEDIIEDISEKARLLIFTKDYSGAISEYERIIDLREKAKKKDYIPNEAEDEEECKSFYNPWREYLDIGICKYQSEDYNSAIFYFSKSIQSAKDISLENTSAYILHGEAKYKLKDQDAAYADWKKAEKGLREKYQQKISSYIENENWVHKELYNFNLFSAELKNFIGT